MFSAEIQFSFIDGYTNQHFILYFSLKNKKVFVTYTIVYGLSAILLSIAVLIKPNLNPVNEFIATQKYFEIVGAGNAEIKNSPTAFFSTLFRPSLLSVSSNNFVMKVFAGSETLMIYLLLIFSFFKGNWKRYYKQPIVVYVLCIVIFYYVLLGLTIPNLGALFRYKSMVLPLLMPVLLLVLDVEQLYFKKKE